MISAQSFYPCIAQDHPEALPTRFFFHGLSEQGFFPWFIREVLGDVNGLYLLLAQ